MLDDYFLGNQPRTDNAEVAEYVTVTVQIMPVSNVSVPKKGKSSEPLEPPPPLATPLNLLIHYIIMYSYIYFNVISNRYKRMSCHYNDISRN